MCDFEVHEGTIKDAMQGLCLTEVTGLASQQSVWGGECKGPDGQGGGGGCGCVDGRRVVGGGVM